MGEVRTELLEFAFRGVNIVPTMILILTQLYWILASLSLLDIDFLDIDIEGAESSGLLNALAMFINFGQVPVTLVLSIFSLNFWILMMLLYYLPIAAGGIISGILLIPLFMLSFVITKYQVLLLKMTIFEKVAHNNVATRVLDKRCKLKSKLVNGQLGQAEVVDNNVSMVINVRTEFDDDSFDKDEYALVYEKDETQNVYYITKL